MTDVETQRDRVALDEAKWRDILARAKTTWLMLHVYGTSYAAVQFTLLDFDLDHISSTRAHDLICEEIDRRIPAREST